MNEEPIIRVQIEAPTLVDLRAFTDEIRPADLGCRGIPRQVEGKFVIDGYLPEPQLQAVRASRTASRVSLRVIENATEVLDYKDPDPVLGYSSKSNLNYPSAYVVRERTPEPVLTMGHTWRLR
jgi:hypothetical protein